LTVRDQGCIFSPDTGVLAADKALHAIADAARNAGARIMDSSPCDRLVVAEDHVDVLVGNNEVRTRRLVVAAGAGTGGVPEPLGVRLPLRVTREQGFYFRTSADVIPFIDRGSIARYGVPDHGGAARVKVAEHGTGVMTSPDERSFEEDRDGRARVVAYVRDALPSFDPEPVASETCLYTTTPDEGFILDARGPIVIASACSGHGFKFGPIVGELIAAM